MLGLRTRLAVAAAVLSLAAPLSTVSAPAQAGVQERTITLHGIQPHAQRFFIKGKVRPAYENRPAVIQRRVGRDGRWKAWRDFRTNDRSRYRERILPLPRPGRVFYRVKVDASDGFAKAFSGSIFIRTFPV